MAASGVFGVLKGAAKDFSDDECPLRAAALAYYTVFAMPPLLVLLIMIAGFVLDPQDVQRAMETQFAGLVGSEGAKGIHEMIASADQPGSGSVVKTVLSIAGLVFGATGAFIALQGALNHAWEVKPDPKQGGIKNFIVKRVFSIGMVLGIGFLLAVSMALTAGISAIGERVGGGVAEPVMYAIELVASLAVLAVLFAAIYKILPDAKVQWSDVWVGGVVTALLFVVGKFALGYYLGRSEPGSAFGAAGALAIILVWVYYAGMIILFGAEFTQRWAESRGRSVEPEEGAIHVEEQEIERPGAAAKGGGDKGLDETPRKRKEQAKPKEPKAVERPTRPRREIVHASSTPSTPSRTTTRPLSGDRFIDRVADRAVLLAIGGILVKKVFADIKQPKPAPDATPPDRAREDIVRSSQSTR